MFDKNTLNSITHASQKHLTNDKAREETSHIQNQTREKLQI